VKVWEITQKADNTRGVVVVVEQAPPGLVPEDVRHFERHSALVVHPITDAGIIAA